MWDFYFTVISFDYSTAIPYKGKSYLQFIGKHKSRVIEFCIKVIFANSQEP